MEKQTSIVQLLGKKWAGKVRLLPNKTESGLYLPPNAPKKTLEVDVVYVGDEVTAFEQGDVVIVDLYTGTDFVNNLVLFEEKDVLAILEED